MIRDILHIIKLFKLKSAAVHRIAFSLGMGTLILVMSVNFLFAQNLAGSGSAVSARPRSIDPHAYVIFKRQDTDVDVQDVKVAVELARTQIEISRGLMFRDHLSDDRGMLFSFDREQPLGFWMKNTLIPLDIIFISESLEIVSARTWVPPCKRDPCPVYRSEKPAKFVVEVNAGFVEKHGITRGGRVEINVNADRVSTP